MFVKKKISQIHYIYFCEKKRCHNILVSIHRQLWCRPIHKLPLSSHVHPFVRLFHLTLPPTTSRYFLSFIRPLVPPHKIPCPTLPNTIKTTSPGRGVHVLYTPPSRLLLVDTLCNESYTDDIHAFRASIDSVWFAIVFSMSSLRPSASVPLLISLTFVRSFVYLLVG